MLFEQKEGSFNGQKRRFIEWTEKLCEHHIGISFVSLTKFNIKLGLIEFVTFSSGLHLLGKLFN